MDDKTPKALKRKRRKRLIRKIILLFFLVLVLAAAGFYAWSSLKQQYTVTYTAYTATTGSISNALSFSGTLALIDSKTYSAEAGATVRTLYVAPGDQVRRGDKLLRLSNGTTFTADFDGRINTVSVKQGEEVTAGTQLLQLADFAHMKCSIRVDEYDISSVSPGDRCTVTATATEKRYASTVDTISYISSSGGNVAYYTGTVYVDVDPADGVYPGMQVTVSVPQQEATDVVILKEDALSFSRTNQAFVYVMNDAGDLEEVEVEIGVSNGNYVEIRAGIAAGDTVYAETETKTASAVTSLLSSLFGGRNFNGGGSNRQTNNRNNTMPGGFGGGNFGNFGGGR